MNRIGIILLLATLACIAFILPEFAYLAIGIGTFFALKALGSATSSKRKLKVYAYKISMCRQLLKMHELMEKLKNEARGRAIGINELCMELGMESSAENINKVSAMLKSKWRAGVLEFHSGYACMGKWHREKIAARFIYNRLLLSGRLIEGNSRQILKKYNAFVELDALANAWKSKTQATLLVFSKMQKRRAILSMLAMDTKRAKMAIMLLYGYAVVECI